MTFWQGQRKRQRIVRWRAILLVCCLSTAGLSVGAASPQGPPIVSEEPPRVQALLEQAWMAEAGYGLQRNPGLAASLYRQAGQMGSGEGYYRAALTYLPSARSSEQNTVRCLLVAASQLGHLRAAEWLEQNDGPVPAANCQENIPLNESMPFFDLASYLSGLSAGKKEVVRLIRELSPHYAVDSRLALAVASVESNFNRLAVSPKAAMGVMQLIPDTAARFGVVDPFNAEQNVRGGLAYLRWLKNYYRGDLVRVAAAYNAGEKAVDTHGGVPPYAETRAYVVRVLSISGIGRFSASGGLSSERFSGYPSVNKTRP